MTLCSAYKTQYATHYTIQYETVFATQHPTLCGEYKTQYATQYKIEHETVFATQHQTLCVNTKLGMLHNTRFNVRLCILLHMTRCGAYEIRYAIPYKIQCVTV